MAGSHVGATAEGAHKRKSPLFILYPSKKKIESCKNHEHVKQTLLLITRVTLQVFLSNKVLKILLPLCAISHFLCTDLDGNQVTRKQHFNGDFLLKKLRYFQLEQSAMLVHSEGSNCSKKLKNTHNLSQMLEFKQRINWERRQSLVPCCDIADIG